ncbi:MAG: hypothetical protein NTU97_00660 [Candidatus Magasanikbacteria bacterium]|nr:hypothetical protein [Candidatus Magasanikbacteria bacterium]
MKDKFTMSTGQADELAKALGRNGWTNADVKQACQGHVLGEMLSFLRGGADIVPLALSATVEKLSEHLIDTSAAPFLPEGWKVEEHKKGGQFLLDPTKVRLRLSHYQQGGRITSGYDLRKELAGIRVLNACVLDYLLAHPELIPESWKSKYVYFWGTIYRGAGGNLYVRSLCWNDGGWYGSCRWLGRDWHGCGPAAVVASI